MKTSDYLPWFESILGNFQRIPQRQAPTYSGSVSYYDHAGAQSWVSEAGSALAAVFPPAHYCCREWIRLGPGMQPRDVRGGTLEQMLGVFQAATKQLREGRLVSLIDGIRADTEVDLLDQALVLLEAGYTVAAAVIAGGALESHLKHLVSKNNLAVAGEGSISKYNDAISKARNDGTVEVYSKTDAKQVTAWGSMRNDAAHNPMSFDHAPAEVRLMVAAIRQFIAPVS